eukprot:6543188-Karenia_brevis.AAC.1
MTWRNRSGSAGKCVGGGHWKCKLCQFAFNPNKQSCCAKCGEDWQNKRATSSKIDGLALATEDSDVVNGAPWKTKTDGTNGGG